MDLRETNESAIRRFWERRESHFRSADLPLWGLPSSYRGGRSLGGWEGVDDRTISLSLVHGDPPGRHAEVVTDDLGVYEDLHTAGEPTLETYELWKGTVLDVLARRHQVLPFQPQLQKARKRRFSQEEQRDALAEAFGPVTETGRAIEVDGEPVLFSGLAAGEVWAERA